MNLGQLLKLVAPSSSSTRSATTACAGCRSRPPSWRMRSRRWWSRDGEQRPFSYRSRKDGSVAIFWRNRPATVPTGMLATRFLEAAPEASEEERQPPDGARDRQLQARNERAAMSEGNGGVIQLTAKDFKSDQEVRWCPGCGDYAILNAVQSFMPELGLAASGSSSSRVRLRRPLPVLHADLRDALDPRPRRRSRPGSPCPAPTCPCGS